MSVTMGYKMTDDNGCAPNLYHGVLTLATCKPAIRRCRRVGEWGAGFASKKLVESAARLGVSIPRDGLVYRMQIAEVLPLHEYFEDNRFACKRPPRESSDAEALCGDNIYYLDKSGREAQLENRNHRPSDMPYDRSGCNALVTPGASTISAASALYLTVGGRPPKQFIAASVLEPRFAPPVLTARRIRSGSCGG